MQLSVRYALRVVGLRTEFYKMAADDPSVAKMMLPTLEKSQDMIAADNMEDTMEKLQTHMNTQMMKVVAALKDHKHWKEERWWSRWPRQCPLIAMGEGSRPLWRKTQSRVEGWHQLGCSEFLCHAIRFRIYEQPSTPFRQGEGVILPSVPQTEEDLAFGKAALEAGCKEGIYHAISPAYAERAMREEAILSSAFTVWQEGPDGRKGRFVANLSRQSAHWHKGSLRVESLPEFGSIIQPGDHFLSFDIRKGYRHFRLAPAMRNWFIFHYYGKFYQCVALPFGWGRSTLWFTQFMAVFVKEVRRLGMRVLAYLDDFLEGTVSSWSGRIAGGLCLGTHGAEGTTEEARSFPPPRERGVGREQQAHASWCGD